MSRLNKDKKEPMKNRRFSIAALLALLILVGVMGAVQAHGHKKPHHPPIRGKWGIPRWGWGTATQVPQMKILAVVADDNVTFETTNLPENETFTVLMGRMYTKGTNGVAVGTFNSSDGVDERNFPIPPALHGSYKIAIRIQTSHAFPYYAYNWFYNNDTDVIDDDAIVDDDASTDDETTTTDDDDAVVDDDASTDDETTTDDDSAVDDDASTDDETTTDDDSAVDDDAVTDLEDYNCDELEVEILGVWEEFGNDIIIRYEFTESEYRSGRVNEDGTVDIRNWDAWDCYETTRYGPPYTFLANLAINDIRFIVVNGVLKFRPDATNERTFKRVDSID